MKAVLRHPTPARLAVAAVLALALAACEDPSATVPDGAAVAAAEDGRVAAMKAAMNGMSHGEWHFFWWGLTPEERYQILSGDARKQLRESVPGSYEHVYAQYDLERAEADFRKAKRIQQVGLAAYVFETQPPEHWARSFNYLALEYSMRFGHYVELGGQTVGDRGDPGASAAVEIHSVWPYSGFSGGRGSWVVAFTRRSGDDSVGPVFDTCDPDPRAARPDCPHGMDEAVAAMLAGEMPASWRRDLQRHLCHHLVEDEPRAACENRLFPAA